MNNKKGETKWELGEMCKRSVEEGRKSIAVLLSEYEMEISKEIVDLILEYSICLDFLSKLSLKSVLSKRCDTFFIANGNIQNITHFYHTFLLIETKNEWLLFNSTNEQMLHIDFPNAIGEIMKVSTEKHCAIMIVTNDSKQCFNCLFDEQGTLVGYNKQIFKTNKIPMNCAQTSNSVGMISKTNEFYGQSMKEDENDFEKRMWNSVNGVLNMWHCCFENIISTPSMFVVWKQESPYRICTITTDPIPVLNKKDFFDEPNKVPVCVDAYNLAFLYLTTNGMLYLNDINGSRSILNDEHIVDARFDCNGNLMCCVSKTKLKYVYMKHSLASVKWKTNKKQ